MNLKEHHERYRSQLQPTTLAILTRTSRGRRQVCLAMKLRGFGAGKWNFFGGKQKAGENTDGCSRRETFDETRPTPRSQGTVILKQRLVAVLYFYFDDITEEKKPKWNQRCHVYMVDSYQRQPRRSEEMAPHWFDDNRLPFEEMWQADNRWVPLVLTGRSLTGLFLFTSTGECLDSQIIPDQLIFE